jgi:hypothetical protein
MSGAQLIRLPTTRDIYMNQSCTCVGKVGETVKDGGGAILAGGSRSRLECRIRMSARADRRIDNDRPTMAVAG